jgi:hypothetical protein
MGMFEIIDSAVYLVEQVPNKVRPGRFHIVKTFHCWEKKILIESSRVSILADMQDVAYITFRWQRFDIDTGQFLDDNSITDSVLIDFSGVQEEIEFGEVVEFVTGEPGQHVIRALVARVENGEVTINAD